MKHLFAFAMLTLLVGCMPFSKQSAPNLYALHAVPIGPTSLPAIAVAAPEVPPGFDSDRIALYMQSGRRLDYYARAAWPDRLPRVLQEAILASIPGAVSAESGLPAPYTLRVRVRDFAPVYAADATAPPLLRVTLETRLIAGQSQKTAMHGIFSAEKMAAANSQSVIVAGLEDLLHKALSQALRKIKGTVAPPQALAQR